MILVSLGKSTNFLLNFQKIFKSIWVQGLIILHIQCYRQVLVPIPAAKIMIFADNGKIPLKYLAVRAKWGNFATILSTNPKRQLT